MKKKYGWESEITAFKITEKVKSIRGPGSTGSKGSSSGGGKDECCRKRDQQLVLISWGRSSVVYVTS